MEARIPNLCVSDMDELSSSIVRSKKKRFEGETEQNGTIKRKRKMKRTVENMEAVRNERQKDRNEI